MSEALTPEEDELLAKIATRVVELRMDAPAIFLLESVKPLNFVGSQAMLFFQPIVSAIFPAALYQRLRALLEKRQSIEALIRKIEAAR
ncbi:MAG: hypothetical protein AABZ30_11535 [Myxococcota bacterium]